MKELLKLIAITAFLGIAIPVKAVSQIDVLVLTDVDLSYANTRIYGWLQDVNDSFSASDVDIRIEVKDIITYKLSGDTDAQKLDNMRRDPWVKKQRNLSNADIVSHLTLQDLGVGGVAYTDIVPEKAFNIVQYRNKFDSWAHELGHNMGLGHSVANEKSSEGNPLYYGRGYGFDNYFTTIMAYPSDYHDAPRIGRFSNPRQRCEGIPCGVSAYYKEYHSDSSGALNYAATTVANHRTNVNEPHGLEVVNRKYFLFVGDQVKFDFPYSYGDVGKVRIYKDTNLVRQWFEYDRTFSYTFSSNGSYHVEVEVCDDSYYGWCTATYSSSFSVR